MSALFKDIAKATLLLEICRRGLTISDLNSICLAERTLNVSHLYFYTRLNKVLTIEVDQHEHVQRTDMDDAYAFHVPPGGETNLPHTSITTNLQRIDNRNWIKLQYHLPCDIQPTWENIHKSMKINTYGSYTPLAICGQLTTTVESAYKIVATQLVDVGLTSDNLLSYETAKELAHITATSTHVEAPQNNSTASSGITAFFPGFWKICQPQSQTPHI